MVRLLAMGLALAGFLPVLVFVTHSVSSFAKEIPDLSAVLAVPWPPQLVFAVLGVAVMGLGALIDRRQLRDAARARWDEQLRRVQLSAGAGDVQWISPAEDRLLEPSPTAFPEKVES